MRFRALFLIPAILTFTSSAIADVTPSDVFQSAQHLNSTLDGFHLNNFSNPGKVETDTTSRKPRHVYQAGLLALSKINDLRFINSLDPMAMPKAPAGNITPKHVLGVIAMSFKALEDLNSLYVIESVVDVPALIKGKSPTDVYHELKIVQASINNLGIVATIPNDVFQLASLLYNEVGLLGKHYAMPSEANESKADGPVNPAMAYEAAAELLESLDKLAQRKDIEIPGGVTKLKDKPSRITPSSVAAVILTALADVGAIKKQLSIKGVATLELASGKTPKDVFLRLKDANSLVDSY